MARKNALSRTIDWLEARLNLTEVFSLLSIFGLFYREVDTNKPLRQALKEALAKPLPAYARWPRVLGLLTLILFVFEVITGVLLAFYYQASINEAYDSVLVIVRDVNLGWFVRQMHYWGAQLMLVVLILRLLRFFFRGLYGPPRELIWIAACFLFIAGTHLDFTGRVLVWNNASYWSSLRAMEVLVSIPLVGSFFSFLTGGSLISSLSRFYFFHIVLLPIVFWVWLYVGFAGIRRVGLSSIERDTKRTGKAAYLGHLYQLLILFLIVFGILVTFSVLWPISFGQPVDPYHTPAGSTIPWYLLAPYGLIEFLPQWIPLEVRSSLLLVLLLLFIFFPFVDAGLKLSVNRKRLLLGFGVAVFVGWVFFSFYGLYVDMAGFGS